MDLDISDCYSIWICSSCVCNFSRLDDAVLEIVELFFLSSPIAQQLSPFHIKYKFSYEYTEIFACLSKPLAIQIPIQISASIAIVHIWFQALVTLTASSILEPISKDLNDIFYIVITNVYVNVFLHTNSNNICSKHPYGSRRYDIKVGEKESWSDHQTGVCNVHVSSISRHGAFPVSPQDP